jgi:predicted solute-binding protein
MYVNDWTRTYGEAGEKAVRTLFSRAADAAIIPERTEPEFAE